MRQRSRARGGAAASLLALEAVGHKAEWPFLGWEVGGLFGVLQGIGGVQDAGPGALCGVHTALDPALLRRREAGREEAGELVMGRS